MPPRPRYTVRLPSALDALVQARVEAGTPFAVLIRAALSAYLADLHRVCPHFVDRHRNLCSIREAHGQRRPGPRLSTPSIVARAGAKRQEPGRRR